MKQVNQEIKPYESGAMTKQRTQEGQQLPGTVGLVRERSEPAERREFSGSESLLDETAVGVGVWVSCSCQKTKCSTKRVAVVNNSMCRASCHTYTPMRPANT